MTREMARLLISPTNAWPRLRQDYDHHPFAFLVPLLLLPLLPAACLFIGTTQVGWSLPGNDSVQHLSSGSALLLATMCYLGFVAGVVIMGFFVRWVLFRTPSRPSVPGSLTFTTAIAVPLMLAGIVALVPWRILLLLARRLPAPTRYACCSPACRCSCACRSGRHCSTPSASSASAS